MILPKFTAHAALASLAAISSLPTARADLYAYNGFDYAAGGTSGVPVNNGDTLVGLDPSTKSLGSINLAGASAGAVATGQGGLSNIFQTTGLTFGTLQVRGGGARYDNDLGQAAYLSFNYSGSTVPAGTTLYSAHLVRILVNKTQGSVVSLRMNTSKTGGSGTAFFTAYSDTGNTTDSKTGTQYGTGNANTTTAGPAVSENVTYLVVGRFTNVGMTTGTRTATIFVLNEDQFANYADGGFGEAEWDAATLGTGSGQIVSRATDTYTGTSSFNLVQNGAVQAGIGNAGTNGGLGQDVLYDEIRVGSTLSDVIPAGPPPEPALIAVETLDAIATEPSAPSPSIGRIRIRRLDASTHAVTIQLTASGTATPALDYPTLPASVAIPENAESTTIEIRPFGDRITEPDETVIVTAVPGTGYTPGASTSATVTIQDGPFVAYPTRLLNNLAEGKPQKIVVYGTSLTAGNLWPPQVKAGLDAAFPGLVTLVNSGGSGQNSVWGVANLKTKVTDLFPDTVIIEFAVNDAVNRDDYASRITPAQARANLNSMIETIQSRLPDCEIILQVMNPVINSPSNTTAASTRPNLALCQQYYRDVGNERGLLVMDHMPAWQSLLDQGTSAYLASTAVPDGLHPSATGLGIYCSPVILRELGLTSHIPSGAVMLHTNNHRAAEPLSSSGPPRPTLITLTRGGPTTDPLEVSLGIGGTATNGTDYATLPATVTIPAGETSVSIEMTPLSDSIPEGEETFTIEILPQAGYSLASPSKASLLIEDLPFDSWRKGKFTPSELGDPLVSGDNADPDRDGLRNLVEFFTNRNPKAADAANAIVRGTENISGSNYLTLTYDRLPASKLTGIPQTSGDLTDWHDGPSFIQETILSDDGLLQTIKVRSLAPIGSGPEFMRLKVVRDP